MYKDGVDSGTFKLVESVAKSTEEVGLPPEATIWPLDEVRLTPEDTIWPLELVASEGLGSMEPTVVPSVTALVGNAVGFERYDAGQTGLRTVMVIST